MPAPFRVRRRASYPIADCVVPCCTVRRTLLQIGRFSLWSGGATTWDTGEQVSLCPIRRGPSAFATGTRRLKRRGRGAAAWANARPISRWGAIGAIGGAGAGSSGGRLRSRSWRRPIRRRSDRGPGGAVRSSAKRSGAIGRLRSTAPRPIGAVLLLRSLAPAWSVLRSGARSGAGGGGRRGRKTV